MEYAAQMAELTWWQYVLTVTGGAAQKDIAEATGIDQSSISRWQRGRLRRVRRRSSHWPGLRPFPGRGIGGSWLSGE